MSSIPLAGRVALLALALLLPAVASAQADDWPAAAPADVASIDAIISTVYRVISGPATEERDWDRFLSMMHPEARLIPTGQRPEGPAFARVMTARGYAEVAEPIFRDTPMFQGKGFYEVEAARRVERYGSIAHVWSTYESRLDPAEAPFARGINSFQLFWDGDRWHVLSIFWHQEDAASPIPAPYLPEG